MSNYNNVIELEKQERFAEAGYGRLFAYKQRGFNAMIDARMKAKFIRKVNPTTYEKTQNHITYAGPTVFLNKKINIEHCKIDKMDIKSAYLAYLVNQHIRKPGIFRIKHPGAYRHTDRVSLYIIKFNCSTNNLFVKWFLNSSAIQKKKFKTDNNRVWGTIGVFSSTWMNNLKYISRFLSNDENEIIRTYTFHGKETVPVRKEQIHKLYRLKELGQKTAKSELVQSTGWLSIIDRPTYYHMIQYIKFHLLETTYNYELENDIVGVQTDCLFIRVTEENTDTHKEIMQRENMAQKQSSIGTYTHQRVNYDDIITKISRVVLKDA